MTYSYATFGNDQQVIAYTPGIKSGAEGWEARTTPNDDPAYLEWLAQGNSPKPYNYIGLPWNWIADPESVPQAKELAVTLIAQQSNEAAKETLSGLSYDVYVAQSTLPADQRIVKYQAAINANNAIALETEQREQAIYAAATIEEVNAIVYPPAAS